MSPERWQSLIERLDDAGTIESKTTEELVGRPGSVERVIVKSPLGKVRLSWTSEPKRLEEKAFYSKRGGSNVSMQTTYDETEQIHAFTVERWDDAGARWAEMDKSLFA